MSDTGDRTHLVGRCDEILRLIDEALGSSGEDRADETMTPRRTSLVAVGRPA